MGSPACKANGCAARGAPAGASAAPARLAARGAAARLAWLLLGASCLLLVLGAAIGSTGFESLWGAHEDPVALQIIRDIRAPRVLGAWLAGALLGLAGAIAQGLFRNPLADPYLLGSASGASFGVATALVLMGSTAFADGWWSRLGITSAAFVGATGAVFLTLMLAQGVHQTMRLLLAGVVVGVVLGALGSLIAMLQPDVMLSMQAFMLGSTGFIAWSACALMALAWLLCLLLAIVLSRVLDGLSLGEATAVSLGLPLQRMRAILVATLALATGTAVAQTGLIAFVGLAAPHLVRSLVRSSHRALVLLSSLMGGVLLLAADLMARWVIAPQELPVGVLTAVLGGGYLLWLMHRRAGPRAAT